MLKRVFSDRMSRAVSVTHLSVVKKFLVELLPSDSILHVFVIAVCTVSSVPLTYSLLCVLSVLNKL